jgi:glycine hydroxymethyltransferase
MSSLRNVKQTDPEIYELIKAEEKRQKDVLEMIPSENYTSSSVLETLGTVLNNKYSEGYPKKRYYQGNQVADAVEILAQERAKALFGVEAVNVQALSGAAANTAAELAVLENGDTIMGLKLSFGGHLTHGAPGTFSSRFFRAVNYTLGKDAKLDYEEIEKLAKKEKPKLIICGFTAYPREIDFKRFGEIADMVGAYLMADISHIAGLVVAGVHSNPVPYVHIVTTTTHKTLRGPRGALIMVTAKGIAKDADLPKKIDSAIIPGLQGGPHDNQTAAIAVALKEASTKSFVKYASQIIENAKALATELTAKGYDLVSGGTDNHLLLIDLKNKNVNGRVAALALEKAGVVLNYNGVPYDPMPPLYASGIRLGTPAITTRGMKAKDMKKVANWIDRAISEVSGCVLPADDNSIDPLRSEASKLTTREKRQELMKEYRVKIRKNKKLSGIAKEVKSFCAPFKLP